MSEISIARRYAAALHQQAEQVGVTSKVDADIDLIQASFEGSRDLGLFFNSPIIAAEKKQAVVASLFGSRVQATTLRFIQMLVDKRREGLFQEVIHAYRGLRDEQLGIVEAQARVALPLSDGEEKALVQSLEKMTGKRVRLNVALDDTLVGGAVIRIGDTVYDGSVRHKLNTLRHHLASGSFAAN